jgi:hypothetical protein
VADNLLLDFVFIKLPLLHLGKVPSDNKLASGCDDCILLFAFYLVEPENVTINKDKKIRSCKTLPSRCE